MKGQKNYFGKGDVRPSLPGVKQPDNPADPNLRVKAKTSLKDLESSASDTSSTSSLASQNNVSTSDVRQYESASPSLYVGSHKTHANSKKLNLINQPLKNKSFLGKGFFKKLLLTKLAPIALIGAIIVAAFAIFGSQSFLGAHIEALFTEATNSDYTAYNLRSNEIMLEILQGKQEMPDYLRERLEKEHIKVTSDTTLEFNDKTITAGNFIAMYNSDVYFREAITYARRGRIATFFDGAAESFYKKLGLSRDVLHSYNATGDKAKDTEEYNTLMTNYFAGTAGSNINTAEEKEVEDEETEETSIQILPTGDTIASGNNSSTSAEELARAYLDSVGDKVSARTPGCAAYQIGNIVATAIAANSRYIPAHEYMTTMESISKAKYGSSDSTAINSVLDWFTQSKPSTVYDARTGEKITLVGSPMESEGMRTVLGGLPADRNSTRKYSIERSYESTNVSLLNSGLVADACMVERAGGVVLSLAALAVPGSALIRTTAGILLDVAIGAGVQIVASSVLSLLIPTIAEVMYTNPYTNAVGIAGGETFTLGAANINMLAAQQNSGSSGASRDAVLAYNSANNLTIAQQAEIDRKNHSPFDVDNKNTFFGSIAHSLLPLVSSMSSLTSSLTTLSSITHTSLASLNPTYADGEDTTYLTSFGDYCDKIGEVYASGNMYCTMIAVNDLSMINTPEDDAKYQEVISESIEIVDGKETVKDGSPLADYITYWMGRYSMPGIYDASIADACEHRLTSVPILTDIVAMVESIKSDYCRTVADGSRYINSPENPYWEEKEKYHQLWALTARVKENLGFYSAEDNPLAVYRAHYEAEHPLDNSRSGYLARISGLSKQEAELALGIIDYYQELANYHPENTYDFTHANQQITHYAFSSDYANYYILSKDYYVSLRREGQIA